MARQPATPGGFKDSHPRWRVLRLVFALPLAGALAFGLAGCAPEPGTSTDEPKAVAVDPEPEKAPGPAEATEEAAPAQKAPAPQDCGWGAGAVAADLAAVPTGQEGDLADVLPGSWQHVGIDEGAGYDTDLSADIRFVFPSTSEIIYCQDVPGITDQAENRVAFKLSGTEIMLPEPATGYAVQSWSDDAMVWLNHRDGSLYLLQRR